MRKVSEYESHAGKCRQLAATATNATQRQQLLEMADAWTRLARERLVQLGETVLKGQQFSVRPHGDDAEQTE